MPFTDEQLKRAEAAAERPTLDGSQAGRDAAQAWVATWDWKGGRRADHWAAVDWKSFWAQAKKDWAKITAAARARGGSELADSRRASQSSQATKARHTPPSQQSSSEKAAGKLPRQLSPDLTDAYEECRAAEAAAGERAFQEAVEVRATAAGYEAFMEQLTAGNVAADAEQQVGREA